MVSPRVVLDCLSKAMIAVALMLTAAIALMNPPVETPARTTAATLLALGIAGLVALRRLGQNTAQHR